MSSNLKRGLYLMSFFFWEMSFFLNEYLYLEKKNKKEKLGYIWTLINIYKWWIINIFGDRNFFFWASQNEINNQKWFISHKSVQKRITTISVHRCHNNRQRDFKPKKKRLWMSSYILTSLHFFFLSFLHLSFITSATYLWNTN